MLNNRRFIIVGLSFLWALILAGCSVVTAFSPTDTPTPTMTPNPTSTPTLTPTATEIPFYLDATVWSGDLKVPILIYHRFVADHAKEVSDSTKMRYSDFSNQLQSLYDNGFSLVSLQDWMDGDFVVPVGRKPLILTIDDLWFGDQIFIEADGTPSIYSGIGILWAFSQAHPDFGFAAAGFSNMGDKKTADIHDQDYFIVSDGNAWMDQLARTIAWSIENGFETYNHLYNHPMLSITTNAGIVEELKENDRVTRFYLSRIGREDLIPELGNMIALPYGEWPATQRGIDILEEYTNPEDEPVQAIFEAYNLAYNEQEMTSSIFSEGFDPYKLARIMATVNSVQWVIDQKDSIPSAGSCKLGPLEESRSGEIEVIQSAIQKAVESQACPEGVYNAGGTVFIARDGSVNLFRNGTGSSDIPQATLTPTSNP